MQRIIINADDLGLNKQVNKAILHFLESGKVSSSTIMASGYAFSDAIEIAKRFSNCSFGVHLTIDDLTPLSPVVTLEKYGLVEDGQFVKDAYKKLEYNKEIEEVIYEEWKRQIMKIREAGISISHLDSHRHCHSYSFFPRIVKRLADEFEIKKVRLNRYTPLYIKLRQKNDAIKLESSPNTTEKATTGETGIVATLKRHFERLATYRYLKHNFVSTDYFCSFRYYCANEPLLSRYHTIELMCHPGHPSFEEESRMLEAFNLEGKDLISYLTL